MKERIFKKCLFATFLVILFTVVISIMIKYDVEGEKELPFSRLPFSVRNDKYNPIGTAFLTKDGRFLPSQSL